MQYKIRIMTFNEIGDIEQVCKANTCKRWTPDKKMMMGKVYTASTSQGSCQGYYKVYTTNNSRLCFHKDWVEVLEVLEVIDE